MPLFAPPLNPSVLRPSLRTHLLPPSVRKRKRVTFELPGDDALATDNDHDDRKALPYSAPQSDLAFASTNPLSLAPDEINQYRGAGLELDRELPSKSIVDFPHRGLPHDTLLWGDDDATESSGDEDEEEEEEEYKKNGSRTDGSGMTRGVSRLRMRHFGVLTGILHRCLLKGDIARAKRAWAMLLRMEFNGKSVDIRSSGYWGIGAELLVREGEGKKSDAKSTLDEDGDVAMLSEDDDGDHEVQTEEQNGVEKRWGTPAGLEKAKEYYERLILQHPYRRQFSNTVNSLDFWPAMLGCEIYGIQYTQTEALRLAAAKAERAKDASEDEASDDENSGQYTEYYEENDYSPSRQRWDARRLARVEERAWQRRDSIRRSALLATAKLAARMDGLMTSPPYSDSAVLNRLRGMVALYMGDLSVPELPLRRDEWRRAAQRDDDDDDEDDEDDEDEDTEDEEREYFSEQEMSDRRYRERLRRVEHRRGIEIKERELVRARRAFEKVREAGGRIQKELARLSLMMVGD